MKIYKYMLIILDILLLFSGMYIVLTMVEDTTIQYMLVFIILSLVLINLGSYFYFRKRFIGFSPVANAGAGSNAYPCAGTHAHAGSSL